MRGRIIIILGWTVLAVLTVNIVLLASLARDVATLKREHRTMQTQLNYLQHPPGNQALKDEDGWTPTRNGGRMRVIARNGPTGRASRYPTPAATKPEN